MIYDTLDSSTVNQNDVSMNSEPEADQMNRPIQGVFNRSPRGLYTYEVKPHEIRKALSKDFMIQPTGNIGGRVLLDTHQIFDPVHDGIGVYIEEIPNLTAITDKAGYFFIVGIPEGTYTVRYLKKEYATFSHVINVVGLTTVHTNHIQNMIALSALEGDSNTWEMNLQVEVATELVEPPSESYAVEVVLEPLFPHQTPQPPPIILDQAQLLEDHVLTFSLKDQMHTQKLEYQAHDVFNISVSGEDIFSTRMINILGEIEEVKTVTLKTTEFMRNPYVVRDHDNNGIADRDQTDIDGDGCIENDESIFNPFVCELAHTPEVTLPTPEIQVQSELELFVHSPQSIPLTLKDISPSEAYFMVEIDSSETCVLDPSNIRLFETTNTNGNREDVLHIEATQKGRCVLKISARHMLGHKDRSPFVFHTLVIHVLDPMSRPGCAFDLFIVKKHCLLHLDLDFFILEFGIV